MQLSIEHISKSYKNNKALSDFTAELTPGIYALLGPNGSGKSTLMNIITGNLNSDAGRILLDGENILDMGDRFRERLGYMPQYPGIYPTFSISRFLWYMATLKGVGCHMKERERKAFVGGEIERILTAVELYDVKDQKIGTLSGGMKQRLCLAQAVLGDPDVLILDEPTAGLDPKQRIHIRNFISEIATQKIVIIATHVVSDIEYIAKEVILLKKGRILDRGTPEALTSKVAGKVWKLSAPEKFLRLLKERFRIISMAASDTPEELMLRILSETKPHRDAVLAEPTLEDQYLAVFGEEI